MIINSSIEPVIHWASIVDAKLPKIRKLFKELENYQALFIAEEKNISGSNYRWPIQPLYEWSRRVEYPWIVNWLPEDEKLRVLDAGSGVTFFPIYIRLARRMTVECLDLDNSYPERMSQFCARLGIQPQIPFHVADLTHKLPIEDGSFDVLLCISVLEHISSASRMDSLYELWRILRPGGVLILSVDVCLDPDGEGVYIQEVQEFLNEISRKLRSIPSMPTLPTRTLLTPQRPGYGTLPVRYGNQVLGNGPRSWMLRTQRKPLPGHARLACLLLRIPKTY